MSNPAPNDEAADQTDAMIHAGHAAGKNRQCSIGWHSECSDPNGYDCQCACHQVVAMAQHAITDIDSPVTAVVVVGENGQPHFAMTPTSTIAVIRSALTQALKDLVTQEAEEALEAKKARSLAFRAALSYDGLDKP